MKSEDWRSKRDCHRFIDLIRGLNSGVGLELSRLTSPEVKKRSGKISHPVDLICDALLQPDEVKRDLEELVVKLSENGGDGFT